MHFSNLKIKSEIDGNFWQNLAKSNMQISLYYTPVAKFKLAKVQVQKSCKNALTSISSSFRSEASIFGSSPAELFASSGGRETLLDRLDLGGFFILNFLGFLPLNMGL